MDTVLLDPLAPAPRGTWSGQGVRVRRRRGPHRPHGPGEAMCTPRFCAQRHGDLLTVEHNLVPDELCDELAVMLVEQLVDTGALRGQAEFELVFTGVVRSTVDGGMASWLRFYRNSLDKLESGTTAFAPVHTWAVSQVQGRQLIDLGSCFGFFPLRLARHGLDVTATDLSAGTMRLLQRVSSELRRPVRTRTCDAADTGLPDGSADTVTALHLMEHLPDEVVDAVADEALRLARKRVVIAVPFEEVPQACYGHLRSYDLPSLRRLAERLCARHPGVTARVHEFHGGWLILDR